MHPALFRGTARPISPVALPSRVRASSASSSSSSSSSRSSSSSLDFLSSSQDGHVHAHRHHYQHPVGAPNDEARLEKSVKFLEMNRQAYTEESKALLQKQARVLESLRKEHDKLQAEVASEAKTVSLKASAAWAAKQQDRATVARLKEQLDRHTRQNAIARKNLKSLQQHANTLQAKQEQQRRALGGVDAPRTQDLAVAKQVHRLENQVEKALGKLNESLSRHKDLKTHIDELRRERLVFTQWQQKLQKELGEKQAKMAQVIEACNQAYEARDKAKAETTALAYADAREMLDNEAQLHELTQVLEAELRRSAMRPALLVGGGSGGGGRRAAVSSSSLPAQHRLSLLVAAEAKEERARRKLEIKQMEEELEQHNSFLDRITELTGYDDVERLLAAYMRQEEQNFSLYTYVNQEQWREIKGVEAQLAEYKVELELVVATEGEEAKEREVEGVGSEDNVDEEEENDDDDMHKRHHHPTSSSSSALATQLQALDQAILRYENKSADAQQTLDLLRKGISSLATAIHVAGGAKEEFADMSEGNLMPCLARIEGRMEEILQAAKVANREMAKAAQQQQQQQQRLQQHSPQPSSSSMSKILPLTVDPVIAIATGAGEDDDNEDAVRLEDGMAAAGARAMNRRFQDQVTFQQKGHQHRPQSLAHIEPPRVDDYSSDEDGQNGSSGADGPAHYQHQQQADECQGQQFNMRTSPPSTPPPTASPHVCLRTPPRPLTRAQVEESLKRSGLGAVEASAAGARAGARLTFADNSTSLGFSLSALPSSPSGPSRKPRRMSHFFKTYDD